VSAPAGGSAKLTPPSPPPGGAGKGERSLGRVLTLSAAGGAAVYVAIACYVGAGKVGAELKSYAWWTAGCALALAAFNYGLRFVKWELYLRRLGVRIPLGDSLGIFLSGFSLTVTPGKVGEVLKSYLLRETHGVPMARTAPTVVAERVTDLIALLVLTIMGVGAVTSQRGGQRLLWVAAGLVTVFLGLASSRKLAHLLIDLAAKLPFLGKAAPKLREFYAAMAELVKPVPLTLATLLSIVAWAAECLAFWVVLQGFSGTEASLTLCTFIYAAMTIAGALSFLPGGLLVQEGGMVTLLVSMTHGISEPRAAAATFVTRLCTLWFAVLVGVIALTIVRRKMKTTVDLAGLTESRS
jgi:glycosyltransferase 2 family protein